MSKRSIVLTDSKTRRVVVTPSSTRSIALSDVAKKLGAEPTGAKIAAARSPIAVLEPAALEGIAKDAKARNYRDRKDRF